MPTTFVLDDEEEAEQDVQVAQLVPSPWAPAQAAIPAVAIPHEQALDATVARAQTLRHAASTDASEITAAATLAEAVRQVQDNQQCIAEAEQLLQDLLQRSVALSQAQRRLEQRAVLAALTSAGHQLGCHDGRPVAALLIHRCLLHWRVPEGGPDAAALLERLLAALMTQGLDDSAQQQEQGAEDSQQPQARLLGPGVARLAYWLASSSTLLALLTKQAPRVTPQQAAAAAQHSDAASAAQAPTPLADRISEMQRKTAGWAKGLFAKISAPSAPKLPAATGATGATSAASAGVPGDGYGTAVPAVAATGGGGMGQEPQTGHDAATGTAVAQRPVPAAASEVRQAESTPVPMPLSPQLSLEAPGAALESFRQHLATLTLRQYGLLRDAFKRQLAALIPACVQRGAGASPGSQATSPMADRSSPGSLWESASHPPSETTGQVLGGTAALRPWADLVLLLSGGVVLLQDQAVPRILIKCLLKQLLAFIDVQMFNQMLLRPECCAASNAHFMAEGLAHLDAWLGSQAGSKDTSYLAALQADLRHTRQAVCLLVHPSKGNLSCNDITRSCKSLSLQQLYRLCTTFWDDLPPALQPLQRPSEDQGKAQEQQAGKEELQAPVQQGYAAGAQGELKQGAEPEAGGAAVEDADPLGATAAATAAAETAGGAKETASAPAPSSPPRGPVASEGGLFSSPRAARATSATASEGGMLSVVGRTLSGPLELGSGGMVSGEVLEELKSQSQVSSNGGLIVTFLLDEDQQPIIATRPATLAAPAAGSIIPCSVAYEILYLIDSTLEPPGTLAAAAAARAAEEGHGAAGLYHGVPVPQHLLDADTPREPFLFLEQDVQL